MKAIRGLIKKYEKRLNDVINPDGLSWIDLGCKKPIKGYKTVEEYIEANEDFDEGQQTEKSMCKEIIDDLQKFLIKSK